jgi:hypothetical protein
MKGKVRTVTRRQKSWDILEETIETRATFGKRNFWGTKQIILGGQIYRN